MRPLKITSGPRFSINGHADFHKGKSENPKIGTVEDWYLINLSGAMHPIHIHLIQFQHLRQYTLKMVPGFEESCSFYDVDFVFKNENVSCDDKYNGIDYQHYRDKINGSPTLKDYQDACTYIANLSDWTECFDEFGNEEATGPTSGIDVMTSLINGSAYDSPNMTDS